MLENLSTVKRNKYEKEENKLALNILNDDMNDMLNVARNTKDAV